MSRSIIIDVCGTTTKKDLIDQLKQYKNIAVEFPYIVYRGYRIKLIVNHGNISINKFMDACNIKYLDRSTYFPKIRATIDLDRIDQIIERIESNSKVGKNNQRAATFRYQMFAPYLEQAIQDACDVTLALSQGSEKATPNIRYTTIKHPMFTIWLITDIKPFDSFINADFEDVPLTLKFQFRSVDMPTISKPLSEWRKVLPQLLTDMTDIVTDITQKNTLRSKIEWQGRQEIERYQDECRKLQQMTKHRVEQDIKQTATSMYTVSYMEQYLKSL